MKVTFIYPERFEIITGGQKYESDLRKVLNSNKIIDEEIIYLSSKPLLHLKYFLSPFISLKFLRHLSKTDIIVFNSSWFYIFLPLNFILTKIFKKNTVTVHHHYMYLNPKTIKEKFLSFLERRQLKISKNILTPSPLIRDQTYKLIKKESILCEIPFNNCVNMSQLKRQSNKLLYVGTIEERKGLIYLMEALKLLNERNVNYELNIVGKVKNNEYYIKINDLINKYRLNVIFHGFISEEELNNLYDSSDIFVFPSLQEGFGMSVNEAMCHGLPVICFNNSALPYSVNTSNGILVENKNSNKFADAILDLISDNNKKEKLRIGAYKHSLSLPSYTDFQKKVNDIFNSL